MVVCNEAGPAGLYPLSLSPPLQHRHVSLLNGEPVLPPGLKFPPFTTQLFARLTRVGYNGPNEYPGGPCLEPWLGK